MDVKIIKVVDHQDSLHTSYFAVNEERFQKLNPDNMKVIESDDMADDKEWQDYFHRLLCHPPLSQGSSRWDLEIRLV